MTNFELPTRICIIGASTTGKTQLMTKLLYRGDFGQKKDLEVLVYAPSDISIKQSIYSIIKKKGFDIKCVNLRKTTPPPPPKKKLNRLIVFDDVDNAHVIPNWVTERFTIASHHLNESIVCISHRLRIGVVEIRSSAEWIILTPAPEAVLRETCKTLNIGYDFVRSALSDPENIIETSPSCFRSFNHIVIKQMFCVDGDGNESPRYFKISNMTSPAAMTFLL
jgi:hypothetical protein